MGLMVESVIETMESDSRFPNDKKAQDSVTKLKEAWNVLEIFIDPDKFRERHREFIADGWGTDE